MEAAGMSAQTQYGVLEDTPFSSTSNPNAVTSAPLRTESLPRQLHSRIPVGQSCSSLLFVDVGVTDYQSLIAGVQPGTEVHILDSTQDAIAQITQTLMGRSNISSLHILSHGTAGNLQLGADWVGISSLNQHASQLQSWASALTDDADVLLYGCDVAEGGIGQTFVQQLARLTGADVAASNDLTGSAALGGDWNLEVKTGAIEASNIFQPWAEIAYQFVLASFGSGNLVVTQVGDGTTAPTSGATAVFLNEYKTSGSSVQSIALPTTVNNNNRIFALSGTATSEGALALSANGKYLTLAGYDASLGTANVSGTTSAATNRIVAKVDMNGVIDTSTRISDGYSGNSIRSAVTIDGSSFWTSGVGVSDGGTRYVSLGNTGTSTQISSASNNTRVANIFGGRLYTSSASSPFYGVSTVGSAGVPTTSGQPMTLLSGFPGNSGSNPSSTGFVMLDRDPNVAGVDTLYIADSTGTVGLQKYSFDGSTWTLRGNMPASLGGGLTGVINGSNVDLYTVAGSSTNNQLVKFTDTAAFNANISGSFTTIASAGTNKVFRGVALVPQPDPTISDVTKTFPEEAVGVFTNADFASHFSGGTLSRIQIKSLPTNGSLKFAGNSVSPGLEIAVADLPKLNFIPNADYNGSVSFSWNGSNGTTYAANAASVNISVTPVNDAPVLDTSGNPTLSSIYMGNTNSTGTRISDLISSLGGSKITDVDNAVSAIALTSADNTNGTWQFSTNSGSTWQDIGVVSDSAARVLGATSLYTAGLNTLPSSQSWLSYTNLKLSGSFPIPGNATQTLDTGGTTVNTSADINNYAGYSNYNTSQQLVNANFPTLDRAQGFGVAFNLQVLSDSHTNNDRAAFSIILLGSDKRGIELAFQDGKIFAQNDDSAGGQLFTAGENAVLDTKLLTSYRVAIKDDTYQLFAGNTLILTGAVRDYRNWQPPSGFPSPYLLSNFVFLGDNTTSAQGSFYLTQVALQTDTRLRFVPNASYTGNAQISFRAWDVTNGSSNGQANVSASSNGGTTAFSTATETAAITVKPLPTLSINDVSQGEGNSGTKTYTFTVTLSQASTEAVTVNYTAIDGNATVSDGDYQAASGTLTFNVGEVSKTIEIQVNGDTKFELDETFLIKLSNASNAKITPGADIGVGTIVDDDKSGWTIAKTADFDNDGKVDILWRNISTGGTAIWKMNGTTFDTSTPLPVADTNWRIEGVADFDKNGYLDLLWRNISTGTTAIWKMTGFTVTGSVALPTAAKEWKIESVADFDKDGFVDILWRNTITGGNAIWKMNGTSVATSIALSTTDLHWQIQGVADFDNDGFVDILWHNTATGGNAFWKMNGMSVNTSVALPATPLEWQIAGVADFDNDGRADILWRNTSTGGMALWKMNGTSAPTSTALSFADLDWQVEDLSDLDGDGFVDIVWRNYNTGGNALWKMSGTTVTTSIALRPA